MNSSATQGNATARTRSGLAGLVLFACFGLVLVITLFPVAPDLSPLAPVTNLLVAMGIPAFYAWKVLEAILNVLMFVPFGFLLGMLLPSARLWWLAVVASAAVSFGVELVQAVALAGRSATVIDFVANTAGGALGAVAAMLWRRSRWRRGGGSGGASPIRVVSPGDGR